MGNTYKETEDIFNMFGRKKSGIVVRTFASAGRYQHDTRFFGEIQDVPEEVVDMLKRANERLYEHMPEGSEGLVSRIEYRPK